MLNPVIKFNNISFTYSKFNKPSLNNIDMEVNEGEVLVLCGKSGCGKTTIIRIINGLIPNYFKGDFKGKATIRDYEVQTGDIYSLGQQVSTVFQNPKSQFYCVDVKSELAFAAENLKFAKDDILKRIDYVSHQYRIEKLIDKTMFQLSGGEKQKIACASVSVTDNPIVVLDEPSSNLDVDSINELKNIIKYWKGIGKTIVIAEHRLEYLKDVADRFVYMENGNIQKVYSSKEIQKISVDKLSEMGLRCFLYDSLKTTNYKREHSFIKLKNFKFRYKSSKENALNIEGLKVPKNSIVAIIGKNGAGKSTFMRCLCGLERKSKGILLDGEKQLKPKERLNNSFLVMQDVNHQLFTESVEEEILLSMPYKDMSCLEKLIKEFDLEGLKKRYPMSLSGGQKQRVAIACACASESDYIIFDEPTSGLDYYHMCQVSNQIKQLQLKGKNIFLITHDIELIYSCCNYIIEIEDGRIKKDYLLNDPNKQLLNESFNIC